MDDDPHDMHFSAPVLIWPARDSKQTPDRRAQIERMLAAFTDLPPLDQAHLLRALDQTQLRTLELQFTAWGKPLSCFEFHMSALCPVDTVAIARWLFVEPDGVFEDTESDGWVRPAVQLFIAHAPVGLQYDTGAKAYRVFGSRAIMQPQGDVIVRLNNPRQRSVAPRVRLECALIEREPAW